MDFLPPILAIDRWIHVFAGIMWIGMLFFFNFVNAFFAPTMDSNTKQKVIPELMPRALFWGIWGAALTWITGIFMLIFGYYDGGLTFEDPDLGFGMEAIIMIAIVFFGVFIYDQLYLSKLASNVKLITIINYILIGIIIFLMKNWAGFSYRSFNIHLGVMFGTIMVFNVWFRIWPTQKKIIRSIKNGVEVEKKDLELSALRSKHTTYMSVPLLWTMINSHTSFFSGGNLGITETNNWLVLMIIIAFGWFLVFQCYKISGKVKGF